jgi:hypothetical protein
MDQEDSVTHISRHWHHWLAVLSLLAAGATLALGGAAVVHHFHGGYRPGPLPPPISISGQVLPQHHSLVRFLTRTHNQGNSNSCVGQTVSTIVEITQRERHPHRWRHYSAGYIWDLANGGQNVGISYPAAFGILDLDGDARLRAFPYDGPTGYWVQPAPTVIAGATAARFQTFRSISPWDQTTMESEIAAGRPIAVAIPVTDSFYNLFGSYLTPPLIAAQAGAFHFFHSITGVGYTPAGLIVQNSWGPSWGHHGRAVLSWSFLGSVNAAVVVATPFPARA